MSNQDLQKILSSPDKEVSEATNALARLYRIILKDHNVDYNKFSKSITTYLNREQSQSNRSREDQSRDKGNLVKELSGNSFTFKNFIKGLKVLNPVSAELSIRLTWRRGHTSEHSIIMNIQDLTPPDNKED